MLKAGADATVEQDLSSAGLITCPLVAAVVHGHREVAKALLEAGADMANAMKNAKSPLSCWRPEAIKLLEELEKEANDGVGGKAEGRESTGKASS